jgi:nesprin-2
MEESGEKAELLYQALARKRYCDLVQNVLVGIMISLSHRSDTYKLSMVFGNCREQFESVAQLSNSLKEHGLEEEEEIIMESTHLIDRYQVLLSQLHEIEDEDKLPSAEAQNFHDLTHDVIHWIKEIKESLMALNSLEGKMPLEERIQKIKV